jgi:choline dehydrogenase-like flavoprotein
VLGDWRVFLDARTIDDGAHLTGDVCIVGAGPAGIALALDLGAVGARTVVLAGAEASGQGEIDGEPYPPLASTHAGGVGGSAALWDAELEPGTYGARYAPLQAIDFEERPGVREGGWPFGRAALDPFYRRAQDLCAADPFEYEQRPPPFATAGVVVGTFRFGAAAAFVEAHRTMLAGSRTTTVLLGAQATRVRTAGEGGEVDAVEAASTPEQRFQIRARVYVLAAGGIENARLLLNSGIGNADLVGRCFMDHPTVRCRLELASARTDLRSLDVLRIDGRPVLRALELSEQTLRAEGLLNGGFFVVPAQERVLRAHAAARSLIDAARKRRRPAEPRRQAVQLALGTDALAYAAHRRLARAVPAVEPSLRLWRRSQLLDTLGVGPITGWSNLRARPRVYDVHHVIEQSPDPNRRVVLGATRDIFGLPVARLHWFVGSRELESAERAEQALRDELSRAGVGRLTTGRELDVDVHPTAHHHLGTTRMHEDARYGVVDSNTRLHGMTNLFVTGGSVFPTSGFVNPTLTIVALALRLGTHLREEVMR